MKFITLIISLFLFSSLSAQDLIFSRVIDTVIVVPTGIQQITDNIIYGESLSPEQGKVWKLQSIIHNEDRLSSKLLNCSDGSEATSEGSNVSLNLTIDDGANSVLISESTFRNFDENYNLQIYGNVQSIVPEFPIWINSWSTLRSNIAWNGNSYGASLYCFGSEQIGKIYVSILEFDTE